MTLVEFLLWLILHSVPATAAAPVVVVQVPEVVQEVAEVPVLPEHAATVPEPAAAPTPRTPAPTSPPCTPVADTYAGEGDPGGFPCDGRPEPELAN